MSIEQEKDIARCEKKTLIKMILVYQTGDQYTQEILEGKTLRRLREIYDRVVHHA